MLAQPSILTPETLSSQSAGTLLVRMPAAGERARRADKLDAMRVRQRSEDEVAAIWRRRQLGPLSDAARG